METIKLATCGENVAVWTLPDSSKIHQITNCDRVTCSSWNYDGSCLATCGSRKPDHISITFMKNNVCSTAEIMGPLGPSAAIRAIQYPMTTQKYLSVSAEDRVVLYDIVKKKVRQDFRKVCDVTCLAMNHNDKYIAAGSGKGGLYILNTLTGRPAFNQPLEVSNQDVSLTAVKFNNVRHSMIGASTDAGSVAFWDVNAARELHVFNEHKAPTTGLAFSPVNEVLVLSAGLDKRCVCYDTMTRKPASTIWTDLPLTSVDFALDGTNLVLGTSKGLVYMYDLRSFTSPTAVIEAHNTAVTSVLFQPGGDRSNVSSLLSSMCKSSISSISSVRQNSSKENLKPDENTSLGSQVFSPVRDTSNLGGFGTPNLGTTPVMHLSGHSRLSNESVFSPLRETSFNMISPISNMSGQKKFSTTPQLSSIREEVVNSLLTSKNDATDVSSNNSFGLDNRDSVQPSPPEFQKEESLCKSPPSLQSVVISATTPFYLPKSAQNALSEDSETTKTHMEKSRNVSSNKSSSDVRAILTAFPQAMSSVESSPVVSQATVAKREKACSDFDAFQREYVQAAVEEAMDEFCSDMRKQMWHFHYDMLMAFQRQQKEVQALLKDYAVNESLVEEVGRLREENARLKNTPFVAHFNENSPKNSEKLPNGE